MPHPPRWTWRAGWLVVALAACISINCGGFPGDGPTATRRATPALPEVTAGPGLGSAPLLPSDSSLVTLVSKDRSLAAGYMPADLVRVPPEFTSSEEIQQLRRPAADALVQMLTDARIAGLSIKVNSGFRSYQYQAQVFQGEVAAYGCAKALLESALPGHSEHQLGLAADLTSADVGWDLQDKFGDLPEGRWLLTHAAQYGFVLSYPQGREGITGYIYEPWHFRYVTVPVAQAIVVSGKTPTEYLRTLGNTADTITQSAVSTPPANCK
jgi:D-alanyl-D-alanine carboxypeptidase